MSIEIQAALYYYDLGLLKRENHLYCLVDLKTGEWYEKMLKRWNQYRMSIQ